MKVAETKIGVQGHCYLTKTIINLFGAKNGDILEWHIENEQVIVKKKKGVKDKNE